MPRSAELLGIAHTLGDLTQGWPYTTTFMALNRRCQVTNRSVYYIDLLAEVYEPHELFVATETLGTASGLQRDLERLLAPRGFALSDLTRASIEISVLPSGDGSMFGVRVQLAHNGRVFSRALDANGHPLTAP